MQEVIVPTTAVRDIARALGYRRRQSRIVVATSVNIRGVNWSGGTRYQYSVFELASGEHETPTLDRDPPWANKAEGQTVHIQPGYLVVRHGYFCGKVSQLIIYVHPDNMGKFIDAN